MLNKSFSKRLKVTKNGKILARKPGRNHFNAKASRSKMLPKRKSEEVSFSKKVIQRYIGKVGK